MLARNSLRSVNDILDFSKIDANQLEIESIALDPGVLAEETADIVRDAAREKGLSLSVQRAPELPARCITDPLRLQQILLNLLTNAIKFTGRGGDVRLWVGRDLQMPVMDGYAATRQIREVAPELPIVGQTAHAMPEDRDRCLAAGMVAHMAKPIDPEQLVSTVQEHTQRDTR